MTLRGIVVAVALAATVIGCAGKKPLVPADQLWREANENYQDEAYDYAIQKYKALLDQYPFDEHAEEAELKIGQAYYNAQRYPEAIAAFGNFERMHPTSQFLPETEYHRGLAYLAQYTTADRDQQAVTNALTTFRNITDRFPGTPWAERSQLRIRECREALARHEAQVATWYLGKNSMRAAESRLRTMLVDYPDTDATAETLNAFGRAYADRDDPQASKLAYETVLRHHPDGPWATSAREALGTDGAGVGTDGAPDPLPEFVAFLDAASSRPDRLAVPRTVSAYPDSGNASGQRY
jgi:outer membrane protein assembly factor BamD